MKFEVAYLIVFRGAPYFLDTTTKTNCANVAANTDPCKLYAVNADTEVCLSCFSGAGSEKWLFTSSASTPSITCKTESSVASYTNRASFYYSNLWTQCPIGQRVVSSTCQACDSSCSACSGPGSTQCTHCSWKGTNTLAGDSSCSLNCDTSNGNFMMFGSCPSCTGSCNVCPLDRCTSTSCTGTQVLFDTTCCDLAANKFFSGGSCNNCNGACSKCFGALPVNCKACPTGAAVNYLGNVCVASCNENNGQFFDLSIPTPACANCQTGCLECMTSSNCLTCNTASGYVLNNGVCTTCDANNGNFINLLHNPPTCDACGSNCKQCDDAQRCRVCDVASSYYLGSSLQCLFCDANNGKYIPSTENQCLDCQVQGCKVCPRPSGSTCTACDTANNYYLTGTTCALCQVTNGFFMNTGNNPPTFNACQSTGCLECSGGGATDCTKCNVGAGFYLDGGRCPTCSITNGFFINAAGTACLACSDRCLTCGPTAENCLTCRAGFEKFRLLDGSRDTCLSTNEAEVIRSLVGDESLTDPILRNATLTWTISQKAINDLGEYRVAFSAVDLIFSDFDEANLKNEMKVRKN